MFPILDMMEDVGSAVVISAGYPNSSIRHFSDFALKRVLRRSQKEVCRFFADRLGFELEELFQTLSYWPCVSIMMLYAYRYQFPDIVPINVSICLVVLHGKKHSQAIEKKIVRC